MDADKQSLFAVDQWKYQHQAVPDHTVAETADEAEDGTDKSIGADAVEANAKVKIKLL